MPKHLEGSCHCGAVTFTVDSNAPAPYQACYCSICRKQQGGGGYAINLSAIASTLKVKGKRNVGLYRAEIKDDEHRHRVTSSAERRFCKKCGSALWLYDPEWPELVHPFASAIDTDLPEPPSRVHILLKYKANWVEPHAGRGDKKFDLYPEESLEDWHRRHKLWVD